MKSEEAKMRLVLQYHQVYNSISPKEIPGYTREARKAYYPGFTQEINCYSPLDI